MSALFWLARYETGRKLLAKGHSPMIGVNCLSTETIIDLFQSNELASQLANNNYIRERFDENPRPFCANLKALRVVRSLLDSGHHVRDAILSCYARTGYSPMIKNFFNSKVGAQLFMDIFSSGDLPEALRNIQIKRGPYKGFTIASAFSMAAALDDLRGTQRAPAEVAGGQACVTNASQTLFSGNGNSGAQPDANSTTKKS